MNIDVKTAFDKLMLACKHIQTKFNSSVNEVHICDLTVSSILKFIEGISLQNSGERTARFSKFYIEPFYENLCVQESVNEADALRYLSKYDHYAKNILGYEITELYVSLLYVLGKHYLLSRYDKKDIDRNIFTEKINTLNKIIDEQREEAKSNTDKKCAEAAPVVNVLSSECDLDEDNKNACIEDNEETIEQLLEQLNALIGLDGVKREINTLINLLKINELRKARGLNPPNVSKHLVFLGNPGTGKTTVARLLSKVYKKLGVLSKGQLVEVDREGLVAGYVGQTAIKTKEKIEEAIGGVLFIDEAYALAKEGNDFGQEAIDTLLKAMEDRRDEFIVIVAGYSKPMESFLASNPGLKSRFNKYITFEDYSEKELLQIFERFCASYQMYLDDEAKLCMEKYLTTLLRDKPNNFANGREMRNLFESIVANQANRLALQNDVTNDDLSALLKSDFPSAVLQLLENY